MKPQASWCFVAESGTDVRLVDGMAAMADLIVLARPVPGGSEINHPPTSTVTVLRGPSSRLLFALHAARHVWTNRRRYGAVVVQGNGLAALFVNLVARLAVIPTSMLICSPSEEYYACRRRQPFVGKKYHWWQAALLRSLAEANAIVGQHYVVLSQHLGEVVGRYARSLPIDVVPVYGVDASVFIPSVIRREDLRAALGLPTSGFLIFFSSRIAPEKDSETLLLAVKRLLKSGMDVWLLNKSGGHKALVARAEQLGIASRVIASDAAHPHHELPRYYQSSDVCVQASLAEGLGFSPLEALACEIPVIAAAVGGLNETVVDSDTGWTYKAGDNVGLASRIEAVRAQPVEAARRARRGRLMVAARFERAIVFERFKRAVLERVATRDRESKAVHVSKPATRESQ